MGHGKLKKFAENETFRCLLQPSPEEVLAGRGKDFALKDHSIKGRWGELMFGAERPIVLELGCGRGEYTIDLAKRCPDYNYIGVDIKGARLWRGAKAATLGKMDNVAFLRTRIEFIEAFFAPGEVSEIWLTFSDPQLNHENSRLTSPMFLERYRKFLAPGGLIHLKTDSRFLYEYTLALCKENRLEILAATPDLYGDSIVLPSAVREVKTYYETMFSRQGYKITYLCFRLPSAVMPDASPVMPDPERASLPTSKENFFSGRCPKNQSDKALRTDALCSPAAFDADYWRSIEGPRHSVALPDL